MNGGDCLLILGIDTSCDDTSSAVVENGSTVLYNLVSSQIHVHAEFGGVVPEVASRKHLELIVPVVMETIEKAGVSLHSLDAVAVTTGPGLLGSLLVGVSFAKSLAYALGIPVVPVNHLEGHIYANFIGTTQPEFPLLNLVVSGGHSDLILMEGHGHYEVLGETIDDAAGEVFDKVARELGLPYPGGPYLDKAAEKGDPERFHFPHPKIEREGFNFSFSGFKTRALESFKDSEQDQKAVLDMAASLRQAVVRELLYYVEDLVKKYKVKSFGISGGVAANSLLREKARVLAGRMGIPLYIPSREYCTDNGAMVGACAYWKLKRGIKGDAALNAQADLTLSSWGDAEK